jgi:hypothetical protein
MGGRVVLVVLVAPVMMMEKMKWDMEEKEQQSHHQPHDLVPLRSRLAPII